MYIPRDVPVFVCIGVYKKYRNKFYKNNMYCM